MDLVDLLASGEVEAFNENRGQRRRIDLFAADLAGARLMRVDLSGVHLEKADLTGADLRHANLLRAELSDVDAGEANLQYAVGVGARLKGAWLEQADLSEADFSRANLSEGVLNDTLGSGLRMVGAKLRHVEAKRVRWPGVDLTEAKLHKADFTGADLQRADLTEVSANECVLVGARLDGASAHGAKLPGANLEGASLVGAHLPGANLSGVNLAHADLTGAHLQGANLQGATLTGAKLRDAVLADAAIEGMDLSGLDVAGADLTGMDPRVLGLTEDQLATVGAVGAAADDEALLRPTDISVARTGDRVAVMWENTEGPDGREVLRAVILGPDDVRHVVALPASPGTTVARMAVSAPGGFWLILLQGRPGGVILSRWFLSEDGELGPPEQHPLGYEPGVQPVPVPLPDGLGLWGLARRGPTLVLQRLGEEGLELVRSEALATARGFVGRQEPVLACKGGVVIPIGPSGPGAPAVSPEGFPGRLSTAAISGDRVLVAWTDQAGLFSAWLAKGEQAQARLLSESEDITALDAASDESGVWLAWAEAGEGPGKGTIWVGHLPDVAPAPLPFQIDAEQITWVKDAAGAPWLAITTFDEALFLVDTDGQELANLKG